MRKLLLLSLIGVCYATDFDIKADYQHKGKLDLCNIEYSRDSGYVYIGDFTKLSAYYEATDLLIPKVIYSSTGVNFIYKFTLPYNMQSDDEILNHLGFNFNLKWTADDRQMLMTINKNELIFTDIKFIANHCI